MSFAPSSAPPPPPGQASVAATSVPPAPPAAAPPPDAPVPDLSATTPMSSVATPAIPDATATAAASAPAAAPSGSPQEPGSPGILARLRKHMKGFLLLLFFIGVAILLFFLVFRGGGGGGGAGGSPAAKDLVIRIDKGSQLELQGNAGGSSDCSALKDSLDAISKKQDQLLKLVKDSDETDTGDGGAKNETSLPRSEPSPLSKASAGSARGKVHYSNELSTQAFSPPPPTSPQPGTSKAAPWVRSQDDVQAYGGGVLQPFAPLTPAWALDR